jgi:hypothetical protein
MKRQWEPLSGRFVYPPTEESMNCRRARFLIFAVPILLAFAASQALAQVVTGNPFSIDGTVTDTNNSGISGGYTIPPCDPPPSGTVQNPAAAPNACKQIDENGNAKELGPINSSTTKIGVIHTDDLPTLGDTNPNAQVDLNAGWTHSKIVNVPNPQTQVLEPHVFFYFGWRRDSANGSGFISIEIEKSQAGGPADGCKYDTSSAAQLIANCNPWAGRQAGDFVLLWDQNGSATNIIMAVFTGNSGFGQTLNFPDCSHSTDCVDLTQFPNAQNPAAVAKFGTTCGTGFVANQCGEMAIDLTAAGIFPASGSQCVTLANIIPGTVTGNSNTADYKDVILAPFPSISNCGQLTVTKSTVQPDGTTALNDTTSVFGYTIARSGSANVRYNLDVPNHLNDGPAPQTQIVRPNCYANNGDVVPQCPATAIGQAGIKNGETQTHVDLIAGTNYTLVEQLVATAYQMYSITCVLNGTPYVLTAGGTFPVEANAITACTIVNKFVKTTPGFASKQQVTLQDQAKLTNLNAGGTGKPTKVKISLWKSSDCTTEKVNEFDTNLTYAADGKSAESAFSAGYVVDTGGTTTIYWAFIYDGDSLNNGLTVTDTCKAGTTKESVTVTLVPTQQ